MKIHINIIIIAFICLIVGCKVLQQPEEPPYDKPSIVSVGNKTLALKYNPSASVLHPKVFTVRSGQNIEDIFVIINDNELLFPKAKDYPAARIKIFYKILKSFESSLLVDSCTKIVEIRKTATPKTIAVKLPVKPQTLKKYVIQVTVTDLSNGRMSIDFCTSDSEDLFSGNNFAISSYPQMQPFNDNYLSEGDTVFIEHKYRNSDSLRVKCFLPDNSVALSPYASDPAQDTSCDFSQSQNKFFRTIITATNPGIWVFNADTTQKSALVLPVFGNNFPYVNMPSEMILPLKYLATDQEYSELLAAPIKKEALDNFWLTITDFNNKKAAELIKVFYNRALFANLYFSDYKKGMFTDRGMLYIILGPPHILALGTDSQTWTYTGRSGEKFKFVFDIDISPYGLSEYHLKRSTEYKPLWDKAVSVWRSGNIFTFSL